MAEYTYHMRTQSESAPVAASQHANRIPLADNRGKTHPLQAKMKHTSSKENSSATPVQRNNTGLPDKLKSGVESLSGMSMDHVKVHYNSAKPAQLNAHAYAQGSQIHIAPGQEKHLPHEAWHVVQQAQGRVKPTMQMKAGVPVNDNAGLEKEADVMGAMALQRVADPKTKISFNKTKKFEFSSQLKTQKNSSILMRPIQCKLVDVIQLATIISYDTTDFDLENGQKEIVGKEMNATLDPTDKVHGSAPGSSVQAGLMGALKHNGYKRMIRGHLLNGQLGGLGIAANLFPITSQANAKHKNHVENPIKEQVANGKEIKYTVIVNSQNKMSNPNANFVCAANATDGSWSRKETIESRPGTASSRGSNIEGAAIMNTDSMSFKTSSLPKGWGEKGKGYDESDAHKNTFGKSSFKLNGEAHAVNKEIYAHGYSFNSGEIDRQSHALELLGEYNGDPTNKWPIYVGTQPYTSQELDDFIDTASSTDLEKVIKKLEALL